MKKSQEISIYESLLFFGKVNASISHELKNIMAIISETAGLLNDLADMASEGTAIDSGLLKTSTNSIMEEIHRGFKTIRQMNRFAHCVDAPIDSVDLVDLLNLVINISGYQSYSGKTHLVESEDKQRVVVTSPMTLAAILYDALVFSYKNIGPEAKMEITINKHGDAAWRIVIHRFAIKAFQVFPDERLEKMAGTIGVSISCNRFDNRLELDVPKEIDNTTMRHDTKESMDASDNQKISI